MGLRRCILRTIGKLVWTMSQADTLIGLENSLSKIRYFQK